ncbi:hypothetical protein JYU34_007287 [Plutella xylostella]|uniref:Uncharacterized protein n=1 Tax=Plutella xylostella TaxID=51655 RepID=A0ABQ7QQ37_PLUXY|nr:hypothetical protein JYU34_007287 [Plutella xylostella]
MLMVRQPGRCPCEGDADIWLKETGILYVPETTSRVTTVIEKANEREVSSPTCRIAFWISRFSSRSRMF